MAVQYVAYTQGLHGKNVDVDDETGAYEPIEVGADVSKDDFEPEDWNYHIQHGNIVRKGGPHDPTVLAEALQPEEVDEEPDPKDLEIARLRESLALYQGRGLTPAPGTHISDLADAGEEDLVSPGPPADEPRDPVTGKASTTAPKKAQTPPADKVADK
jgi:hypothetical protein